MSISSDNPVLFSLVSTCLLDSFFDFSFLLAESSVDFSSCMVKLFLFQEEKKKKKKKNQERGIWNTAVELLQPSICLYWSFRLGYVTDLPTRPKWAPCHRNHCKPRPHRRSRTRFCPRAGEAGSCWSSWPERTSSSPREMETRKTGSSAGGRLWFSTRTPDSWFRIWCPWQTLTSGHAQS